MDRKGNNWLYKALKKNGHAFKDNTIKRVELFCLLRQEYLADHGATKEKLDEELERDIWALKYINSLATSQSGSGHTPNCITTSIEEKECMELNLCTATRAEEVYYRFGLLFAFTKEYSFISPFEGSLLYALLRESIEINAFSTLMGFCLSVCIVHKDGRSFLKPDCKAYYPHLKHLESQEELYRLLDEAIENVYKEFEIKQAC